MDHYPAEDFATLAAFRPGKPVTFEFFETGSGWELYVTATMNILSNVVEKPFRHRCHFFPAPDCRTRQ